jgi:hypothetical protein
MTAGSGPSACNGATENVNAASALAARYDVRMDELPSSRASWQTRIVCLAVFAAWTLWIFKDNHIRDGEIGSSFLHMVLLPFHEAGHYALFRWFGQFIMTLGGTLGQHLLPIVAGYALLKKRDIFGVAMCLWLLGFSTVDMSVYMYDAFDPKIMLLGGGTGAESDGHDWQNIFGDMGLLRRARGIGLFFGFVGWLTMFGALAWAARVLWLQRATPQADFPPAA